MTKKKILLFTYTMVKSMMLSIQVLCLIISLIGKLMQELPFITLPLTLAKQLLSTKKYQSLGIPSK